MPDSAQLREKHNTSHPFHFNGKFKEQFFSGSAFPLHIQTRLPFSSIFVLLAAARWPENATCYARFTKKPARPAHAAHAPDCGRAH